MNWNRLEMGEQIDQLQKLKNKLEKDKQTVKSELEDLKSQFEHVQKGKAAAEKLSKQMETQLSDVQLKLDENSRLVIEFNQQKTRWVSENSTLVKQIEEVEHHLSSVTKVKTTLQQQLDEAKRAIDEEARGKGTVSK